MFGQDTSGSNTNGGFRARSETMRDRMRGIGFGSYEFSAVPTTSEGLQLCGRMDRVRRLLLLVMTANFAKLPAAAQSLDAVRLMTVSWFEGAEFPVVHLPGFNQGTIPNGARGFRAPPPDGMVEGAEARSIDLLKIGHEEEQECLFYGCTFSGTRSSLCVRADEKVERQQMGASSYLVRLTSAMSQGHATPTRQLPDAPAEANINLIAEVD